MKTIYSLVTKPINQNVAIIRISGPQAFDALRSIIPDYEPENNKVKFMKLYDNEGNFIDDSLILTFVSPLSFTGENVVEIQSHGNMFIVQKIISMLNKFGLEQSEPGEFMKQAYMNGKIDLAQSEAINTLILSENKQMTELSSKNLNGKESEFINKSLGRLGEILSTIQVAIDYPENYDLPKYNLEEINKEIISFNDEIKEIIFDSKSLIKYSKGITIALVGIPNAGKSTLLNSLLKEDRAIVSDIEGTTRDVVESITYINDVKVTLRDTAGIRSETNDLIEQEGIKRSLKTIEDSDIVLVILDGTKDIEEQREQFKDVYLQHSNKIIEVISKSDLKVNDGINISAFNNDITNLVVAIDQFIKENIFDNDKNNNALLVTQNQVDMFEEISNALSNASMLIENGLTADVVGLEIESAMRTLGSIVGKVVDQDYLTNLFANFCIGK